MTYHPEESLEGIICDCLGDEELSAEAIHEKLIESVASIVEYHHQSYKKAQQLFNLLRSESHVG